MKALEEQLEKLRTQSGAMQSLLTEHAELEENINNALFLQREALRERFFEALEPQPLEALHGRVPARFKPLVARVYAQDSKVHYLTLLAAFLNRESDDRNARASSIESVCYTWSRKPSGLVHGDKSKWLVKIPTMKEASTAKQLGWCEIIRDNLVRYDRYETFSSIMRDCAAQGVTFVAFDAFAFRADPRMPYEGFTRSLFKDLDDARDKSGQARADSDSLRRAEKAAREEERAYRKAKRAYRKRRKDRKKKKKELELDLDFELEYGWDDELDEDLDDDYGDGIDIGDVAMGVAVGVIAADAMGLFDEASAEAGMEEAGAFVDAS
jgi:hypothetical protein